MISCIVGWFSLQPYHWHCCLFLVFKFLSTLKKFIFVQFFHLFDVFFFFELSWKIQQTKMKLSAEDVTEDCQSDFLPNLRSGGYADIGFRSSMEDVYVCVDNFMQDHGVNKHVIDEPSAFYGVYISLPFALILIGVLRVVRMNFRFFFLRGFLFIDIIMCNIFFFLRFVFFHSRVLLI
jgi:hypothetical protein